MRARNIKPGFYLDDRLAECSMAARLLAPGLWMYADKDGRLEYRPKRIKAAILPYDDVDVEALLWELSSAGHIQIYEVSSERFIQIRNFREHQRPHSNEIESTLPQIQQGVICQNNQGEQYFLPRAKALRSDLLIPDSLNPDPLIPESSPSGDSCAQDAPAPQRKISKLSRLPFDDLPPDWGGWAHAAMGWNAEITSEVWSIFRDHWQGKTGSTAKKSDWMKTWQNWCRKERIPSKGNHYDRNNQNPNGSASGAHANGNGTAQESGYINRKGEVLNPANPIHQQRIELDRILRAKNGPASADAVPGHGGPGPIVDHDGAGSGLSAGLRQAH